MESSQYERPEGALVKAALKAAGRSVRSIAPEVGVSDTRIRHVLNGYQPVGRGQVITVQAPADTWSRIARAAGVGPDQLREVGRDDIADLMDSTAPTSNSSASGPSAPSPYATLDDLDRLRYELYNYIDLNLIARRERPHDDAAATTQAGESPATNVQSEQHPRGLPGTRGSEQRRRSEVSDLHPRPTPEVPDDIAASDHHRGHGRAQTERDRQDQDAERP